MMNDNTLNTFSKEEAELAVSKGYRVEKCVDVKVYGINAASQKYFTNSRLDFLSIDIEGIDEESNYYEKRININNSDNVDKYLTKCLESIKNQSYSNIEIILVNDGSSDNSVQVCEKFATEDKRI